MFSGIVEEIGIVKKAEHTLEMSTFEIEGTTSIEGVCVGDSVSVNGVCLTICSRTTHICVFQAMPETLRRSNLGLLHNGSIVNLERSMTALTRIGGHMVQGHIDGTSSIVAIEPDGCALKIWFKKLDEYKECFIPKGYVAIDGMSLTIVDVEKDSFSVCFIPHTQSVTIVKNYRVDLPVNIEVDTIVKTIACMFEYREKMYGQHR